MTERSQNADRVVVANDLAALQGVTAGQSLSDARAVCPDLLTESRDEMRELNLLTALHKWADRFSPLIGIDLPDGLALDVSGCAHLFGGELELATALYEGLQDLKVAARVGIANTKLAAKAFARFGGEPVRITVTEAEHEEIGQLPVESLGLDAETLNTLRRLDLRQVSDLAVFKPSELSRRFSVRLPNALDRLRGHRVDPLVPSAATRIFSANRTLPEPISHIEPVTHVLEALAKRVCADLEGAGRAARSFRLTVRRVDSDDEQVEIGFSRPSREILPILRQFVRPLEALRLPFGADGFRLQARDVELFAHTQFDLASEAARVQDDVDQTLTTLGNRLGFDRLRRPVALSGHAPEDEHGSAEVVDAGRVFLTDPHSVLTLHPRPETIWPPKRMRLVGSGQPPQSFTWKSHAETVVHVSGRERVSPVWWRPHPDGTTGATRDYWRIMTESGRCFWVMGYAGRPGDGCFICGEFLITPHFVLAAQ